MKWTGLTGGIATGKSTVKKLIEGLGYPVIDADIISHQLTEVGQKAYQEIKSHFGESILNPDKSLDRKKLGTLIFSQVDQKKHLESILHPLIRIEVQKLKTEFEAKDCTICFYDVPLLFEKNMQDQFDTTVLIWCDSQTQLKRLMSRNQLSKEEAQVRIDNQMLLIDKVKMAEHCIDNSSDLKDLDQQIKRLLKRLT